MQSTLSSRCMTKVSVLGGLVALVFGLTSGSALAQEESLEEITVTGSRIARDANLSGALPVQSVGEQEIQMSGEFSIADIVNDVPALLSSTTSESSIDSGFADGANILNLRGLGSARTLVLVDGRRHVGGVQGTASVDIGSIPMKLVERVEVLTGGASAIYGADAVTGVVNFIMKDDFEGFNIDANYGISSKGDGEQTALTATWGTNFANDRGNIAVSVDWRQDNGLRMGERPGALHGTGGDLVNPALRFQMGDIGGSTPLLAQYYDYATTGLYPHGLNIPSAADFVADYNSEFGTNIGLGDLSAAEMALFDRAANAPPRAVHPESTFHLTSGYGTVATGEAFGFTGWDPSTFIDLNGNGVSDCLDSFNGYNSLFARGSFGAIGGCWDIQPDGTYLPSVDGMVVSAGGGQSFGGSSYNVYRQNYYDFLLPDDKISVNVMGSYDISDKTSFFAEAKYVTSETETAADPNSFWDLIPGWEGNPFLPTHLQTLVADPAVDGVSITIDPVLFRARRTTERETMRFVLGLEGEFDNSWNYEVSANYGRYEQNVAATNQIVNDRWFAALDAVTDPVTGQPACASSVDPTRPAYGTPFGIPSYDPGYFSFTPGDGSCVPLDIWNGLGGLTQQAMNFMLTDEWSKLVIDQLVFSAFVTGDTSDFFELPAGPISFATGVEYRDESSDAEFDAWQRGVLPSTSPFGAGTMLADVSDNSSLTFRPQIAVANEFGSYDVSDVFLEASIPLLSDIVLARELTLDLAARQSDYSTIGQTTTWKANLIWAPFDSFAFRGTFSEAVRAPNITELYGPQIGGTFRPDDPCEASQIAALIADDPALGNATQANCVTVLNGLGLSPFDPVTGAYNFVDPLTASFGGITGGNPLLQEETAETLTVGFVFQPDFLPGFSLTFDYWDISIADAIQAVSSQNIVDGCYIGPSLNPNFCALSDREDDPNDQQYGGFRFLQQSTLNFAAVETNGFDFTAKYGFELGAHGFDITVQGTSVDEINNFENPLDPSFANPELMELNRPEFAGNVFLNWTFGDLLVGWQSQYLGEMLFSGVESETYMTLYGPIVLNEEFWQHDLSASYLVNDQLMVYGGIKNVTDEQPFITENAFPASPRGTFFFIGLDWSM